MMVMMVWVRVWVFAGKVSSQFVQLAYKVPVSGSCDHQVIGDRLLLRIKTRNREQMGSLTENINSFFIFLKEAQSGDKVSL